MIKKLKEILHEMICLSKAMISVLRKYCQPWKKTIPHLASVILYFLVLQTLQTLLYLHPFLFPFSKCR